MGSVFFRLYLIICLTATLSACAAEKSVLVLLPDSDGKTGTVEIRNAGGSQQLTAPNQATEIQSAQKAPDSPRILPDEEVQRLFGETMAALPPAPAHYTLYFLSDSTRFTEASVRVFEEVLTAMMKINPAEIAVVGHTDRVGSREENYKLGLERANQVKQMLTKRGVDGAIVETTSHGEDNPLIKTRDETPEPENRRVEIVIR